VRTFSCALISNKQLPPLVSLQYSPVMVRSQLYRHLTVYIKERAVFEKFYLEWFQTANRRFTVLVRFRSVSLSRVRSRFLLLFLSLSLSRSFLSPLSFFLFVLCVNFSGVSCIVIVLGSRPFPIYAGAQWPKTWRWHRDSWWNFSVNHREEPWNMLLNQCGGNDV